MVNPYFTDAFIVRSKDAFNQYQLSNLANNTSNVNNWNQSMHFRYATGVVNKK